MKKFNLLITILFASSILCMVCADTTKPRRSVEKCSNYGNADYIYDTSDGGKFCALAQLKNIIGSDVEPKEFPHLALIGFRDVTDNKVTFPCMGSLISEDYVLIVAHCSFVRDLGKPVKVRLGNFSQDPYNDSSLQEIDIAKIIIHPDYNGIKHKYDISLIKLKNSAKLNVYVRPACLYTKKDIPQTQGMYAAQSNQEESLGDVKTRLSRIIQNVLPNQKCLTEYPNNTIKGGFDEGGSQICVATSFQRRNEICQGESGNPLVFESKIPCMHEIVSLTSYGKSCRFKVPDVHTSVPYYLDWIESIVWPEPEGDEQSGWTWPGSHP